MFGLLIFILVIMAVAAHELAHAHEMKRRGITIERIGLGIKVWGIPSVTFRLKRYPETDIFLSPALLGAFVQNSPEDRKKICSLPYADQAVIYGAGIWINVIIGIGLFVTAEIWELCINTPTSASYSSVAFWIFIVLYVLYEKKLFCKYIVPIFGYCMLLFLIISLIMQPSQSLVGPIGIVSLVSESTDTLFGALRMSGLLSISLGMTNMLPIFPLDGGQTIAALIRPQHERLATWYVTVSAYCFFGLIILASTIDIGKLFH